MAKNLLLELKVCQKALKSLGNLLSILEESPLRMRISEIIAIFADFQWGCFGFDSIRHWSVSTSGVGSLPANLSFQTYSWQQLLCTRCVVC